MSEKSVDFRKSVKNVLDEVEKSGKHIDVRLADKSDWWKIAWIMSVTRVYTFGLAFRKKGKGLPKLLLYLALVLLSILLGWLYQAGVSALLLAVFVAVISPLLLVVATLFLSAVGAFFRQKNGKKAAILMKKNTAMVVLTEIDELHWVITSLGTKKPGQGLIEFLKKTVEPEVLRRVDRRGIEISAQAVNCYMQRKYETLHFSSSGRADWIGQIPMIYRNPDREGSSGRAEAIGE